MKAITLWPEWAWAIANLDKRIENRIWSPPKGMIGQRIAIHAGANIGGATSRAGMVRGVEAMIDEAHCAGWSPVHIGGGFAVFEKGGKKTACSLDVIKTSAIVATATLAGCRKEHWSQGRRVNGDNSDGPRGYIKRNGGPFDLVLALGWQAEGQFHWLLEDVRVLDEPIPMKGKQKLWSLPAEIADVLR
jgi:hypothetical protein